jgi:hypothetical protein
MVYSASSYRLSLNTYERTFGINRAGHAAAVPAARNSKWAAFILDLHRFILLS